MTKLANLADIPEVEHIERVSLKPGDVLVLHCPLGIAITNDTAAMLKANIEELFPGHQAIVLADGLELKVMEPG